MFLIFYCRANEVQDLISNSEPDIHKVKCFGSFFISKEMTEPVV